VREFSVLEETLRAHRLVVEEALRRLAPSGPAPVVVSAVHDSLLAPAKRLRPILALLVADVVGGDPRTVVPAACAIEMVHTSSLILDDLPCMDDASTRRGRPACHVTHGEAIAILAAFALHGRAFEILADGWDHGPGEKPRLLIAGEIARAVGLDGMIAGQSFDLLGSRDDLDPRVVEFIHSRKTGALFAASAAAGAIAAGAGPEAIEAVVAYADNLGRAFQIADDLIDATGAAHEAGKDVRQDHTKPTFVSVSGVEGARALAEGLVAASLRALGSFGPRAGPLQDLARFVVTRRH
jgi:geranylgeranyl diphosphate synthase, type II